MPHASEGNKVITMLTANDIYELNTAASILAGGLALGHRETGSVPPEVGQALTEARRQMEGLPEVIENLNLSFERFNTVSSALWRMMELADLAARPDIENLSRTELNSEFTSLAAIVAADAGRQYYGGPRLNLLNQGEAQSAVRIIGYLAPVLNNTAQELSEQKNLIYEVISETINFLGVISQCYSDVEGINDFGRIVNEARKHIENMTAISNQAPTLH